MFNKINKDKILPQIKLKYRDLVNEQGERPKNNDLTCGQCGKQGIVLAGGKDVNGELKPVCEECAISDFQKYYKFISRDVAASHRRRMFDVQYLFGEMLIDKYLVENNLNDFDDLTEEELTYLFEAPASYYNSLFSKRKKIALEQTESQQEIEGELRKVLPKVSLRNFRLPKNVVFTNSQYENLIKLAYAGDWLINASRGGSDGQPPIKKFQDLESYLLSFAKDFGLDNLVHYDKKYGYGPSRKLEESEIMDYIGYYDDDCFWEELHDRLVERDLVNTYGEEAVVNMDWRERFKKREPFEDKYSDEFDKYGIERLIIKQE